ncbi:MULTISPECIES: Ni/Fe-hydrogenase, b-type cytochrome subunit [unclassified Mesorhizobium]|uniref:Ni/Fe-hydrogenase, b-type cytochrome subunit n=1 Tax=unclassified Mesorhizobium TaxID=325217 RepID=UPI000FCBABDD|nr:MULTISPECIES: Ni/Fe-hydrogenase, b-type cytochrome subunit [unclassified Mesorhizobium]RUW34613.1 Ni/Fe-hydrogenase, b-type cytochrome subunit [Mesorhizobium sp. M1E.F.Ca.ET.041.01.1.1]RWD90870.1 MAG: Ni/Fe-hydrogenase, b-type cytochrome subunit [Mesorhizobium sp.]RWD92179.1 MAG: Ni/Fe-hydrogenase, b-type cytochrome subunit [Mesorhizobium sp.]TIV50882.1 MAG: Ni/Fe-hydrogenase, b-type cytochrome subunit [Mesorhizobium sp.]
MSASHTPRSEEAVYVYEAPLRLWHWVNAFAIFTLAGTGYLIGSPPPAVGGEASASFLFGWIRYLHFSAGYILVIGFAFRVYWAFVGSEHARQIFLPPVLSGRFWRELWHEVLWYAMLVKEPMKYSGHNPLATLAMHILFVWFAIFMIVTGLALYGEGEGMGSWQYSLFTSWVIPLFGQSQDVHTWHHLGMWVIICFVIVHVYAAVREDIMSRQSIISSMFSGWRTFRGNGMPKDSH